MRIEKEQLRKLQLKILGKFKVNSVCDWLMITFDIDVYNLIRFPRVTSKAT